MAGFPLEHITQNNLFFNSKRMGLTLTFKSKAIDEFEKRKKTPLANTLQSIVDIAAILEFVKLGNEGISDDDAYKMIDDARAEGMSTQGMQVFILEQFEQQGFLEKSLGMSQKVKAELERLAKIDLKDLNPVTNTLATGGEQPNPQQ